MILWARNVVIYMAFAIASVAMARWIKSTVVSELLIPNLVAIVVALLAINVQKTAVIAVKLRELADKHGYRFKATIAQFRLAIYEQSFLVMAALILSALSKSPTTEYGLLVVEVGAFFIIFAALHIFLDTSVGLLFALFPEDESASG